MLIKQDKNMTEAERIAAENSNNQFLQELAYAAQTFPGQLKEGTKVIFLGGDAFSAAEVALVIDDTMLEDSQNPVENGAITKEINSIKNKLAQDYVVEQGTTADGWSYRKWNSGLAECWAKKEGIAEVKTLWPNQSSLYYGLIGGFSYPIPFLEKPTVSVDLDAQDSWCNKYASTNTETGNIYAVGPVSKSESYTLNIIAIGKWK